MTRLRDVNGTVWYVRNGEILRVGNMSQNWARTVLDVSVAYEEDLAHVQRVLEEVAHDMGRTRTSRAWSSRSPRSGASRRPRPRRRRHARGAEDGAARAVGRGPRDAPADQGALPPRGHRRPVSQRSCGRRRATAARGPRRGRATPPGRHNGRRDHHVLRRDRRRGDDPRHRPPLLRGRGQGRGAAADVSRGGPRSRRGAVHAVPDRSTGAVRRRTATRGVTRACGCATRRSR